MAQPTAPQRRCARSSTLLAPAALLAALQTIECGVLGAGMAPQLRAAPAFASAPSLASSRAQGRSVIPPLLKRPYTMPIAANKRHEASRRSVLSGLRGTAVGDGAIAPPAVMKDAYVGSLEQYKTMSPPTGCLARAPAPTVALYCNVALRAPDSGISFSARNDTSA